MDGEAHQSQEAAEPSAWERLSLDLRASRDPDYQLENRALVRMAEGIVRTPGALLADLGQLVMELCGADSAAVALGESLDGGAARPRWSAH
jgi:hypothetical protein